MKGFIRLKVKYISRKDIEDVEEEFKPMDSIFRKNSIDSIFELNNNGETRICMVCVEYNTKGDTVIVTYEILDETMDTIMSKLEENVG